MQVFSETFLSRIFGQHIEVFHFPEILEIPEISSGRDTFGEKIIRIFGSESNGTAIFRIIRFENFGQSLEVDHFF